MKQIYDLFGDVERFVTTAVLSPTAIQSIINNPNQKSQLMVAIIVDAGEPFVKATYFLEGDGLFPVAMKNPGSKRHL